jgi:hypothetical protein
LQLNIHLPMSMANLLERQGRKATGLKYFTMAAEFPKKVNGTAFGQFFILTQ